MHTLSLQHEYIRFVSGDMGQPGFTAITLVRYSKLHKLDGVEIPIVVVKCV